MNLQRAIKIAAKAHRGHPSRLGRALCNGINFSNLHPH